MAPEVLNAALEGLDGFVDPNVLVGYQTADDAGVYRLDERTAVVQTVDFFTPVVDDPFDYGQIAAANSLSDVYAMGGQPLFALSVVGFPKENVDPGILKEIMRGGTAKLKEARVAVIGGHSVQDPEIKFGYCVTGLIDQSRIMTNSSARPGDALILTKPLGTGIITTGVKFRKTPHDVLANAVAFMSRLNATASATALGFDVSSITDITGFGLAGHAFEMAKGSQVTLRIDPSQLPIFDGVTELVRKGMLPGGIESNRKYIGETVDWGPSSEEVQQILLDPQTSGGLLLAVRRAEAEDLRRELNQKGEMASIIGLAKERGEYWLEFGPSPSPASTTRD